MGLAVLVPPLVLILIDGWPIDLVQWMILLFLWLIWGLPGVLASWTTLPVIGIPLPTSDLHGVDALHAIAQMPPGIPVACVAIGSWGARNAAFLAAQVLGLKHERIRQAYDRYREGLRSPA